MPAPAAAPDVNFTPMWIALALALAAAVFLWLGIDALSLGRHGSPLNPIAKDEMMFGKGHKRPVSEWARAFTERRYPIATGGSMKFYGWLFIVIGVFFGLAALGMLRGEI